MSSSLLSKDGSLRTIIDVRNHNVNTVLNVTPMTDMQTIMDCLARDSYQPKIDMMDAYEQIHVEPKCVPCTALTTPWRTYVSNVLQQGDCNGPSTFQQTISWVL